MHSDKGQVALEIWGAGTVNPSDSSLPLRVDPVLDNLIANFALSPHSLAGR